MKRIFVGAVIALTVPVSLAVAAEVTQRPSPLTLLRADYANANAEASGPVTMIWSVERYTPIVSMQGPRGPAAPDRIRLVDADGRELASRATVLLDPTIHVGVCHDHRPAKGTSWWSSEVPAALAEELRAGGVRSFRFEASIRGEWRPVVLIDSGCRGEGRG